MENYIVRVYRFEKNKPRSVVGIVETIGVEGKKAFMNVDELWEILNQSTKNSQKSEKCIARKRQ